jgi:hypothetical protein
MNHSPLTDHLSSSRIAFLSHGSKGGGMTMPQVVVDYAARVLARSSALPPTTDQPVLMIRRALSRIRLVQRPMKS